MDFADWFAKECFQYANVLQDDHVQATIRIRELEDMILDLHQENQQLLAENQMLKFQHQRTYGRTKPTRGRGTRHDPIYID